MTDSQRARDNAAKLAATVHPALQAEHDAIVARLAEARGAELATLQRQFGARLEHLKARLPGEDNRTIGQSDKGTETAPSSPPPDPPPKPPKRK